MNEPAQLLGCVTKVFGFSRLVRSVRGTRPDPTIPTRCVWLSLLPGVVLRTGSYVQAPRTDQHPQPDESPLANSCCLDRTDARQLHTVVRQVGGESAADSAGFGFYARFSEPAR